jgi:hypothetical protein
MDGYQVCQIYINNEDAHLPSRQYYRCGLNGRYEAKVLGIVWADDTDVKDNRFIRIRSDAFRKPYGTFSDSIMFCNRHEANVSNPQGEFPLFIETNGGGIDIDVTSNITYTGLITSQFDFGILTLAVKKLD